MAKYKGGFGGGGMGNMNNMLRQAQKLQQQMEETQKEVAEKEFEVTSGGGAVKMVINGKREFVKIDRKSTRLNSSHSAKSRMPSSA